MVFKKLLGALGVGGPSVDTVLSTSAARPGALLTGRVDVVGGTQAVDIEHITLSLVTRVEVESGDHEHDRSVEFYRAQVARSMTLPEGQQQSIPFSLHVPWETPITDVYGRHLRGMTVGVRTELAIARAVDKGDLDPLQVHPLPAQEAVLDAMGRLGFRFRSADLERGHIRGSRQTLPFFQEIEFDAAPQYAHACSQVELTFVTDPHVVGVVLEVDKRGGLFSGGHDVYHSFQVPHAGGDGTDWAQVIDAWFQRDVLSYGRGHGGAHGYGHHGHHGSGMGGIVAGIGAGLVGGYVAGEIMDEAFEGDEEG
ncbi:sporulation protein [Pseudonocardia aurantiaca]|uniref:Sporulation protein n=1 Tax=Pseudonocardia aurantiaca TaxID=75290 RepID=A0ABW4FL24_9PSEU